MSNFAEDFSHQATKIIDMEYLTSDNQEAVFFSVLFFSSLIFCGNSQPPRNLTRLLVNILGILVNTSGHIYLEGNSGKYFRQAKGIICSLSPTQFCLLKCNNTSPQAKIPCY
jgi:hypothetical protein